MKALVVIVVTLTSLSCWANLTAGHCRPLVDSKRYLEANFTLPYPRRVVFECTYECLIRDRIESIVSTTALTVRSVEEDARDVVCQGVKTKKVPWGWDFDGIAPFYAFSAITPELQRYAFEAIPRHRPTEVLLLQQLKTNLSEIGKSYRATRVDAFVKAAETFDEITAQLPTDTRALDRQIEEIVRARGVLTLGLSPSSLVELQLKTHAAWRIPSYLF